MERVVHQAEAALSRGAPEEALVHLRPALRYPQSYAADELVAVLRPLREVARALEPSLVAPLTSVLDGPDHVERLYDAARAMYEHDVVDVAALLLGRADRLMPGRSSIVSELCATLGADLRHPEALTVLAQSGLVPGDAFCLYLTAYHRLMTGDRAGAARTRAEVPRPGDEVLAQALVRLDGMLARAEALATATSLDRVDLTGWHALLDGTLLLHELRDGFAMNGRAGALSDTLGIVRAGIEAVQGLVAASDVPVAHVCPAADRDSQILGLALAERLDVPVLRFGDHVRDAIVVVYDVDRLADRGLLSSLARHGAGWWWVHAGSWSRPGAISPDLVTVLHQRVSPPWEHDMRPHELVVRDVLASPPTPGRREPGLGAALARATAALEPADRLGIARTTGRRHVPVRGSPVPSERLPPEGIRTWV